MVFGTFDGMHDGHRAFLKEARSQGGYLIAVVPPNHIVELLKGRQPKLDLAIRFEHLKKIDGVDEVIVGDAELGSWNVIEEHQPDVIAIGYDQTALKDSIEAYLKRTNQKIEIKIMRSYEPHKNKSSFLRKKVGSSE